MPISVLKLPVVINRTGLSRSTIYALVSKGTFPAPKKLSVRAIGWLESDIENWLNNLEATCQENNNGQ